MGPIDGMGLEPEQLGEVFSAVAGPASALAFEAPVEASKNNNCLTRSASPDMLWRVSCAERGFHFNVPNVSFLLASRRTAVGSIDLFSGSRSERGIGSSNAPLAT